MQIFFKDSLYYIWIPYTASSFCRKKKKLKSFWYILVDKKDVLISKLILLKYVKTCKS